jgi:hypothetical protein
MYLGEQHYDVFADVACNLGLVLSGKVMYAESAYARWVEAYVAAPTAHYFMAFGLIFG